MTRRTFYSKLRKYAHLFDWEEKYGEIRGIKDGRTFCPITAVCYAELQRDYTSSNFRKAADMLGLSKSDAGDIASTADNDGNATTRKALLRFVGLAEVANESS